MLENQTLQITYVDVDTLIPNPDNNNQHPIEQYERLKKIIKRTGFRVPIEVSTLSGFIVCGHLRWEVAKQMGIKMVPVIYQHFDSYALEYAHMTAENEIARWSKLDRAAVHVILQSDKFDEDHELLGLNFEITELEMPDTDPPEEDKNEINDIKEFIIYVECKDELEQSDLFEEFKIREIKCKII